MSTAPLDTPTPRREVGTLRYLPGDGQLLPIAGVWSLQVPADIAIRLKRMFPQADQTRRGQIQLAHTDEVARDLDMVLYRYPLQISEIDRRRLTRGAVEHQRREAEVRDIIADRERDGYGVLEPAREPRDYQLVAADLAIATGRLLIADHLGLGKTMEGLLCLRAEDALPALVVCPSHLATQWLEELEVTYPQLQGHIIATLATYRLDRIPGVDGLPDVVIISYAKLHRWVDHLRGRMRTVIFDEAQELRRTESLRYNAAAQVADGATLRVGESATPVYNYGGEIFNVMDVLAPGALGTQDEFAREWCDADRWHPKLKVADPAALGEYLRREGLMIRRTRRDVGRELPPLDRLQHKVASNAAAFDKIVENEALKLAELILNPNTRPHDRRNLAGQFDWRLRKATGVAKAPYVAAFVQMLLASEEKVVMWGWHREVYDIWTNRLRDFSPTLYTGSEGPKQKNISIARFIGGEKLDALRERDDKDYTESRVLMMSLRSGAGVDGLQYSSCKVGVFGELDWSPKVHEQCSGRLHRDGQEDPIVAYFCTSDEGSDPVLLDALGAKRAQSEPMMDSDAELFEPSDDQKRDRIREMAAEIVRRYGGHPS